MAVVAENRKPDTMALARQADLKENAIEKYGELLADHYILLLKSRGESYGDLLRTPAPYRGQRTFLNLKPGLDKPDPKKLSDSLAKIA